MLRGTLLSLVLTVAGSAWATPPGFHSGDAAFQFRLGGAFLSGDSELWRSNEEFFTMDESDFDSAVVGFSFVTPVSNYLEIGVNVDLFSETVRSHYRTECSPDFDCVDEDGRPILHDTELSMVPITFDVRLVPGGRYRIRGSREVLKPVFYVGAGVGLTLWEYEEFGDFIDFTDATIVTARASNDGSAFETHLLAGVELPVSPRTNFLLEARRTWADDDLDEGFETLDRIDLGGTAVYAGLSFRF